MSRIYNFNNNINYTIANHGKSLLGNKKTHPEIEHEWHMDLNHKFMDWNCERFWVVTKGYGHVVTTFGEFDITEGHAYYVPQSTIISTCCEDFMEQYFINFVTVSNDIPLKNHFVFNFQTDRFDIAFTLIDNIIKEKNNLTATSSFLINNAMSTLLSLFIKQLNDTPFDTMIPIIEYINTHLKEKITIVKLAKQIGYTPEYFSTLFKSTFNVSPQQFIIQKNFLLQNTCYYQHLYR